MKRFFFVLFVIANCLLATAQTASSVLSQLTFEEPSKLYRVKGNYATYVSNQALKRPKWKSRIGIILLGEK